MKKKEEFYQADEFKELEQQLLKDIAVLIHKASNVILESNILKEFHKKLNKNTPTDAQIKKLQKNMYSIVIEKLPKFDDAIELIVERDREFEKLITIEFSPKEIKIKVEPSFK